MNLRRKKPNDSLYLLLDTLCNAFGGIILLAVLVVLLTSKEKTQQDTSSESQEMIQRRLAIAQTNLQQSLKLSASLQAKARDDQWKTQMTLLSTRKELQDIIHQSRDVAAENAKELETVNSADPAERLKFLNSQLAAAQMRRLQESNSLAALDEEIKHLNQRIADMGQQVTNKQKDLQRPLRMPREHETGKEVTYVIIRYGHIYPCGNVDSQRNEADIHWTIEGDIRIAEPIEGRGINAQNASAISTYFSGLSRDSVYVVFCVFEDSFPAFIRAKDSAITRGIAYGWEPFRARDKPVAFATSGYIPKAQ